MHRDGLTIADMLTPASAAGRVPRSPIFSKTAAKTTTKTV